MHNVTIASSNLTKAALTKTALTKTTRTNATVASTQTVAQTRIHRLRSLLAAASVALATSTASVMAMEECEQPDRPVMPNGATATMEDMLAGQKAIKAFQTTNMVYMKCLEDAFTKAKPAAESTNNAAVKAKYSNAVDAYNAAVSAEEEVAGEFNVSLRAFRAANK